MEIPETGYAMTAERRVDRVPSRRVRPAIVFVHSANVSNALPDP